MTLWAKTLVSLAVFPFLNALANSDYEKGPGARVVYINGSVAVNGKVLQAGDTVQLGEWIKTGAASGLKLLMPDKSIVDIGANSQFKVQTATQDSTDGQLEYGSVRASIAKRLEGKTKFRVRTKSSVLSARGTEFVVNSVPKPGNKNAFVDQVTVKSGVVEMEAPGVQNLMLNAGKQVTALVNITPQGFQIDKNSFRPVDVPVDALQKTMSVATVKDDTFRQVVVLPAVGSDRQPNSEGGAKPVQLAHMGQDALAGAQIKAASDPEGQPPKGPPPGGFRDGMFPPRDPRGNGLNNIGGSLIERKLNEGVNVTVVFQL
jgi:hypothetical protein